MCYNSCMICTQLVGLFITIKESNLIKSRLFQVQIFQFSFMCGRRVCYPMIHVITSPTSACLSWSLSCSALTLNSCSVVNISVSSAILPSRLLSSERWIESRGNIQCKNHHAQSKFLYVLHLCVHMQRPSYECWSEGKLHSK